MFRTTDRGVACHLRLPYRRSGLNRDARIQLIADLVWYVSPHDMNIATRFAVSTWTWCSVSAATHAETSTLQKRGVVARPTTRQNKQNDIFQSCQLSVASQRSESLSSGKWNCGESQVQFSLTFESRHNSSLLNCTDTVHQSQPRSLLVNVTGSRETVVSSSQNRTPTERSGQGRRAARLPMPNAACVTLSGHR
jgi:hypothetical protein